MVRDRVVPIIITGAGAPGAHGTLTALGRVECDDIYFETIGVDINEECATRVLFDRFYKVPQPDTIDYIAVLESIVARHKVEIILPQCTGELQRLARQKEGFLKLGCKVIVNDFPLVQRLNDKMFLMETMAGEGLPVPRVKLVETRHGVVEAAYKMGYPHNKVVVKPPMSRGGRGFRVLSTTPLSSKEVLEEKPKVAEMKIEAFLDIYDSSHIPPLLVCEYLPGTEYTVDCLAKNGKPILIMPRTREKIRSGISFVGKTINQAEIIDQCKALIKVFNLSHCFGFQFKKNWNDIPLILECNLRVQGTMFVGAFTNANVILGAVKLALGYKQSERQEDILWGKRFGRYWGGIVE